jgi:hypothetical protein
LGSGARSDNTRANTRGGSSMKTIVFNTQTGNLRRGVTLMENIKAIVFQHKCGKQEIITKQKNIKILKIA